MSNEKNINIDLTEITAPNLKENSYGSQLEEKFKNINDNFNKLANREFVKGDKGDSVKFVTKFLSTLEEEDAWKVALKKAINGGLVDQKPIGGFNPYDFKGEMTYIKDDKDNILSSLAYVYIDPRFANLKDKEELKNELAQAIDLSCVVYITGGTEKEPIMEKLDLFPTIYYDANINDFCWKFYGNESGIIARGPAGKDGLNSNMVIVRREYNPNNTSYVYNMSSILLGGEWKEISNTDVESYNNCPAVVLPTDEDPENGSYWLSILYANDGILKAKCEDANKVSAIFTSENLYNIFKNINPYKNDDKTIKNTPGLFLTIDDQNVHMIYAEANEEGNEENRNTLVITSVEKLDDNLYNPTDWVQVQGANMRIDMPTQINGDLTADKITINNNDNDQFGDEYSLGVNGSAVFKKDGGGNGTMIDGSTITTQQIDSTGSLIIGDASNSVSIKNAEITANIIGVGSGEMITQIHPGKITTNFIQIHNGKSGQLLMANGEITDDAPIKINYGEKNVLSTLDSKRFNIDISSLFETKVYDFNGEIANNSPINKVHNYKLHIEQCLNMVHVQVSIEANKIGDMYGFDLGGDNDIYCAPMESGEYGENASIFLIYRESPTNNKPSYKIPAPKKAQYCTVSGLSRYEDSNEHNVDNAGIEFMLSSQGDIRIVRYCRPRNLSSSPFLINISFNYMI